MRNQKKYMATYKLKNPWSRAYFTSKGRSTRLGREHTMKIKDFKFLWERDNASSMLEPSIDRIDNSKGYTIDNCRYIEKRLNISLGSLNRKQNEKQKKASSENIRKYNLSRNKFSKYQGVSFRNKKWIASVYIGRTRKHLGVFNTELEAVEKIKLHKEINKVKEL